MAHASTPFFNPRFAADSVVIEAVTSTPGAISRTTIVLIGPFLRDFTFPLRMLRALIFIKC